MSTKQPGINAIVRRLELRRRQCSRRLTTPAPYSSFTKAASLPTDQQPRQSPSQSETPRSSSRHGQTTALMAANGVRVRVGYESRFSPYASPGRLRVNIPSGSDTSRDSGPDRVGSESNNGVGGRERRIKRDPSPGASLHGSGFESGRRR